MNGPQINDLLCFDFAPSALRSARTDKFNKPLALLPSYLIAMDTTKLSAKGQIVLPKRVRDAHGWAPGVEFVVEDTAAGVLLRPKLQGRRGRIC